MQTEAEIHTIIYLFAICHTICHLQDTDNQQVLQIWQMF